MSEYCYQCERCGLFREECRCKEFADPMGRFKGMSIRELMEEDLSPSQEDFMIESGMENIREVRNGL